MRWKSCYEVYHSKIAYLTEQVKYNNIQHALAQQLTEQRNSMKSLGICVGGHVKKCTIQGGIAPNQVIARSEFEVHRQMFTE